MTSVSHRAQILPVATPATAAVRPARRVVQVAAKQEVQQKFSARTGIAAAAAAALLVVCPRNVGSACMLPVNVISPGCILHLGCSRHDSAHLRLVRRSNTDKLCCRHRQCLLRLQAHRCESNGLEAFIGIYASCLFLMLIRLHFGIVRHTAIAERKSDSTFSSQLIANLAEQGIGGIKPEARDETRGLPLSDSRYPAGSTIAGDETKIR